MIKVERGQKAASLKEQLSLTALIMAFSLPMSMSCPAPAVDNELNTSDATKTVHPVVKINMEECSIDGVRVDDAMSKAQVWGKPHKVYGEKEVNNIQSRFQEYSSIDLAVGVVDQHIGLLTIALNPIGRNGVHTEKLSSIRYQATEDEVVAVLGPPNSTEKMGLVHYVYGKGKCCLDVEMSSRRDGSQLRALELTFISKKLSSDSRVVLEEIRSACERADK